MKLKTITKEQEIEDKAIPCFICKIGINKFIDDFIEVAEYNKGMYYRSIFAHKTCWFNHMSNKLMLQQANQNLNKLMSKF